MVYVQESVGFQLLKMGIIVFILSVCGLGWFAWHLLSKNRPAEETQTQTQTAPASMLLSSGVSVDEMKRLFKARMDSSKAGGQITSYGARAGELTVTMPTDWNAKTHFERYLYETSICTQWSQMGGRGAVFLDADGNQVGGLDDQRGVWAK